MQQGRPPGRCAQRGLTLIELMISISIGLVVVGAVTYLYVGSKGAYRGNASLARIQEAGRFALDSITRDVRRAGSLGCGSLASISTNQPVVPSVFVPSGTGNDPTVLTLDATGKTMPILGFKTAAFAALPTAPPAGWVPPAGGVRPPPSAPTYWGGDILQLQVASGLPVRMSAGVDTANGTITIADNTVPGGTANFKQSDYALLADCSSAAIFQVTTAPPVTAPALLSYATGGAVPALPASISVNTFPTVQHFDQVTYYVGQVPNSNPVVPALYRYSMSSNTVEEVVDNIEDMDVVYGVDNTPNDGITAADIFEHADQVVDWSKVVSVRIALIAVGDQRGVAPANQTLLFRGNDPNPTPSVAWNAPDTRLRQVFSASTALRDRLQ